MRVKAIAVAAAIAFASAVGAASATERLSTLGGAPAEPLSAAEMASIKGSQIKIRIQGPRNFIQRGPAAHANHTIEVVITPGEGAEVTVTKD